MILSVPESDVRPLLPRRRAVILSASASHGGDSPPPAAQPTPAPAAAGGPPAHILIVDDEAVVRTLARTVLERAGYRVTLAADGDEGLRLFGQGDGVDLVLLDYLMPGPS